MPSVTGAVKNLREKGLVNYEKNSFISLTEEGKKIADEILKKHSVLVDFLESILLLSHEKAVEQACNIEHVIDSETAIRFSNCTAVLRSKLADNERVSIDDWKLSIEKGL